MRKFQLSLKPSLPRPPLPGTAYTGLVQAGKLRRSRPVLPPASEVRLLETSPPPYRREHETQDDLLPPGCTIINRSVRPSPSNSSPTTTTTEAVKKTLRAGKQGPESGIDIYSSGAVDDYKRERSAASRPTPPATAATPAAAATVSSPTTPASSASTTIAVAAGRHREIEMETAPAQKTSNELAQLAETTLPTAGASSVAGKAEARGGGGGGSEGGEGLRPAPPALASVTAAAKAAAKVGVSQPLHAGAAPLVTPRKGMGAGARGTAARSSAVRFNPGPTFGRSRGRTKKRLLDPSGITVGDTVGREKILALIADPTLQKVC